MRPRIGQQHRIAVTQQQIRIANHAHPVVRHAMQQNHRVAIAAQGTDAPSAQGCSVTCGDGNLRQHRIIASGDGLSQRLLLWPQQATPRMQRPLRGYNADSYAENEPDSNKDRTPTEKNSHKFHRLQDTKSAYIQFKVQA